MKLHVVHRTEYRYATPVTDSYNEVRLQPLSVDGQFCNNFILKVLPAARLGHYHDFNRNIVQFFELAEPHGSLTIESTSTVTTAWRVLPLEATPFPMSRAVECVRMDRCYDFLQACEFVSLAPDVWKLAMDACCEETDLWRAAVSIMRYVHRNFSYVPCSTSVNTHMLEVIQQRRGVCQDFAHVMLGMCRAMKIPARYVSGYIYNGPADQLLGAQASHAWCEVYLPELGWRGLDPTNNQQADDRYVNVAFGRDYADIVPIKGNYKGTREKTMRVDVAVTRLEN